MFSPHPCGGGIFNPRIYLRVISLSRRSLVLLDKDRLSTRPHRPSCPLRLCLSVFVRVIPGLTRNPVSCPIRPTCPNRPVPCELGCCRTCRRSAFISSATPPAVGRWRFCSTAPSAPIAKPLPAPDGIHRTRLPPRLSGHLRRQFDVLIFTVMIVKNIKSTLPNRSLEYTIFVYAKS